MNIAEIIMTIVYSTVGFLLMGIAWVIVEKLTPFSIKHEISERKNMAVAVMMSALFLSLAVIISAVILS
jgi:putative membrane protein